MVTMSNEYFGVPGLVMQPQQPAAEIPAHLGVEVPKGSSRSKSLGSMHQRDELSRDEGEGNEDRGQPNAGLREDDLDVATLQKRPEIPLDTEQQHIDQARAIFSCACKPRPLRNAQGLQFVSNFAGRPADGLRDAPSRWTRLPARPRGAAN
jgi:hypothetical protein